MKRFCQKVGVSKDVVIKDTKPGSRKYINVNAAIFLLSVCVSMFYTQVIQDS
jgi:hypothetical protein